MKEVYQTAAQILFRKSIVGQNMGCCYSIFLATYKLGNVGEHDLKIDLFNEWFRPDLDQVPMWYFGEFTDENINVRLLALLLMAEIVGDL